MDSNSCILDRLRDGSGKIPGLVIKPLSPQLTADYFDFFNNRAFTDNPPWGGCYCTGFQITKEEETRLAELTETYGGGEEGMMCMLRETVIRQIDSGALCGYLAYVDGVSIGWCNANDKANLPFESANGLLRGPITDKREKVVLCFEIAPEHRGKGIATALLSRVVEDARSEGFDAVEGYPDAHDTGARNEWDYTGPSRLYEKLGFTAIKTDGGVIMRKELA